MLDIAVLNQPDLGSRPVDLARSLELTLVNAMADAHFMLLIDSEERLSLAANSIAGGPVSVSFEQIRNAKGRDPLMRAIGYNTRTVFDATAGWAGDAHHIAAHGIDVIACERNPLVHALTSDGHARCTSNDIQRRLRLVCNDSANALSSLDTAPEVVYLDPMYPQKPGSAAPKKKLQMLQGLYRLERYQEQDAQQIEEILIQTARRIAAKRVVVKRPHHALPLSPNPSGSISAKLVRYDLYPPA